MPAKNKKTSEKTSEKETDTKETLVELILNILSKEIKDVASAKEKLMENHEQIVQALNADKTKKKSEKKLKKQKDPNKPAGVKSPYIMFCVKNREKTVKQNPNLSAKQIIKELASKWKTLSDKEKEKYVKLSNEDKKRYEEEMKDYTASEDVEVSKLKKKAPKRGMSSYLYFCKKYRVQLQEEHQDWTAKEITSELGKMWKKLSDSDKKPFIESAERDKARYNAEKEQNNNVSSTSYNEDECCGSDDEDELLVEEA